METSLDALEALLQFHEGVFTANTMRGSHRHHHQHQLVIPVPNPLDPAQPHLIEGDAPNLALHRQSFEQIGTKYYASSIMPTSDVTAVPNPLITPSVDKTSVGLSSASLCDNYKVINNRAPVRPPAHPSLPTSAAASMLALGQHDEHHDRTDRLLDALNSLPQRGKKRQNLDEFERQELTRIRNREHAKCTRMRKKARNEELIDIEKKYLRLKELETLQIHRRQRLADLIDKHDVEGCPQYSSVYQLACQELHEPEFSMTDTVSLSTGNSGMVKVSIHGIGTESAKPKTMSGVISVDFAPHSTDIVAASLYWSSSTKSIPPSVSFFPSISVLSFVS